VFGAEREPFGRRDRRIDMVRRAAWVCAVSALAAGCFGGGGSGASQPSTSAPADKVAPRPEPATEMVVMYPVRIISQASASTGSCEQKVARELPSFADRDWFFAQRRLTCSPAGGDYEDAGAACAALDDLVRQWRKPYVACLCAPARAPSWKITGTYRGKPRRLQVPNCCWGNQQSARDIAILMPGSLATP
jgi:hypothetical protein